ncbi:Cysteine-rich receptor-like protein kinase 41 [Bienertia sinuspersici]
MRKRKSTTMQTSDIKTYEFKRIVDSLQFDFNTIKLATSNFSSDYMVGEGGFGEVYKVIYLNLLYPSN